MTGKIKLNAASGGGSVSLEGPASSNADVEFKLPVADGSANQVLKTNASGTLSFANGGKILQVVQTTKTDTFSTNTYATEEDITGMSATITPSASTSKILITASINYGGYSNNYAGIILKDNSSGSYDYTSRADSINATNGSAVPRFTTTADMVNTYKVRHTTIEFLHSPNTTNAVTYKLMVFLTLTGTRYFWLNRPHTLDNAIRSTGTSSITLKEIGA